METNDLFHNENIYLRALEPEDLGVLYKWENKTELWEVGATIQPYSRYAIRQYISESVSDIYQTKQLRMMVIEKENQTAVGTIDLYNFDPLHFRIAIGILIDTSFQRKNYASQAIECIEKYVFEHLKLHQIYAFVSVENGASIALFSQSRYEKTGILKDWIAVANGFKDVIVMQKVNPNKNNHARRYKKSL